MVNIKERIETVLKKGYLLHIGTNDAGGPWVAPVIYTYSDDHFIYWISVPECRHSEAIQNNDKVAGSIVISKKSGDHDFALQIEGRAKKIKSPPVKALERYIAKKEKALPLSRINLLKKGTAWYVLQPTKIELIDQRNFGYTKKVIDYPYDK